MRRSTVTVVAAAVAVLATSCYQDFDFTADHKADRYYVDLDGDWWDVVTGTRILDAQPGDLPVPADWDGNHVWDQAIVRPNGDWVTGSSLGTISFPAPAQLPAYVWGTGSQFHILPVPGDYDGDGTVEPAWYRDSDATWFIEGMAPIVFGTGPTGGATGTVYDQDFPVPSDYDGDLITDLATFNPKTLAWSVRSSADGSVSTVTMQHNRGLPFPIPGDYDGVGHAQRATAGPDGWEIEGHDLVVLGPDGPDDGRLPAAADYDGDNREDLSYVERDGSWRTVGSAEAFPLPVRSGPPWQYVPLATGTNIRANIARFTFVGTCSYQPTWCN